MWIFRILRYTVLQNWNMTAMVSNGSKVTKRKNEEKNPQKYQV